MKTGIIPEADLSAQFLLAHRSGSADYADFVIRMFCRPALSADERRIAMPNTAFEAFSGSLRWFLLLPVTQKLSSGKSSAV